MSTMKYARRTIVGIIALGLLGGATGCYTTPEAGEMGVVRNGGPLDNHNIRQVVPNGSGRTSNGLFSETHYYPVDTQQRYYKADACFNSPRPEEREKCTADRGPWEFQTKDGVQIGIEGTVYLNTTFNDSKQGIKSIKSFDQQFATRTFNGEHAYDGNSGWSNFLAAIVDPIVSNNLRETGLAFECSDFVSSCALVQNGSKQTVDNKNNQSNLQTVQQAVATNLESDLRSTLGGTYFKNVKFVITHVDLPKRIFDSIVDAQSQFAKVSRINAEKAQAKAQTAVEYQKYLANKNREKGYSACPSCARQDEIRVLVNGIPRQVTTLVLGQGAPVALNGGGK